MDDSISRQEAIDALGDKPLAWTEGEYELGLQNQWQSDVDALKALSSAQSYTDEEIKKIQDIEQAQFDKIRELAYQEGKADAMRWIPCSERLPEIDELVLVTDDSGGVKTVDVDRCGQYECSEKRFWYYTQNVVAWMPLPEPYRAERREERI